MDLRLLSTFQAIVEQGGFNAAAAELGFAQSTVTQQIQQLERQIGAKLFHRDGKRVRISEAGLLLKEHADDLLRRVNEIEAYVSEVASGAGGKVRIGAVEPFAATHLPAVLRSFLRGASSMEVVVEVAATQSLYKALEARELQFIVAPHDGRTGFLFEPLFFERLAFLLPASSPLARRRNFSLSDVLSERLIVSGSTCEYRLALERALLDAQVALPPLMTITSIEGRKAAAQAGLGVAMIPLSAARPLPRDTVLRTPVETNIGITIGLAHRADMLKTPATIRLGDLIRQRMSSK
jgi:DNA-binding transcriptional LysR family regulator